MGDWVVLAVDQEVAWVDRERTIEFQGRRLILRPSGGELWGDVSLEQLEGEAYFQAGTLVRRFLSVQAWKHESPYREMGQTGGTHRIRIGGRRPTQLRPYPNVDLSDLSFETNPAQDLALALYRDAIGLEPNHTYKFLALFRILNVTLPNSRAQKDWINGHLGDVLHARERADTLAQSVADVGGYLYDTGRSALAHAFQPPLIDPDNFDDTYRVNLDLGLVGELVDLFMERQLGLRK